MLSQVTGRIEVTAATADNAYMPSQPDVVTVEERMAGPGADCRSAPRARFGVGRPTRASSSRSR
jgi:hypothetical protein